MLQQSSRAWSTSNREKGTAGGSQCDTKTSRHEASQKPKNHFHVAKTQHGEAASVSLGSSHGTQALGRGDTIETIIRAASSPYNTDTVVRNAQVFSL